MSATVTLVLGGARSGKSAWAERAARESGKPVLFLATATAGDDEMAERIAAHRAARLAVWRTVEAPTDLAGAVREHARPGDLVLVDCLTLWVSNVILGKISDEGTEENLSSSTWSAIERETLHATRDMLVAARVAEASIILISNEVGLGVVPAYPLGRRYRDILGRVNQVVAAEADSVILLIAGLTLTIKET